MSDTIFDKIIRKEIPAKIAYEDTEILAFHDINPQAPTHVLVVPKHKLKAFADLEDAPDSMVSVLFKGAAKVAHKLGLNANGYRVIINNGKHGQQTVDYIHVHILGGRQLEWPPG